MQYILTPHANIESPIAWWDGAFTGAELDLLQSMAKAADKAGRVGSDTGGAVSTNIRRSNIAWMNNTPETKWVFDKLAYVVSELNADLFHFDLTGFGEPLQLSNYDQSDHGMYGWHVDFGQGVSRKLSMAVQLTDPDEYEGGNFEYFAGGRPNTFQRKRGIIAVFPSYLLHQVTPVVRGSRQSLVAWVSGPRFK